MKHQPAVTMVLGADGKSIVPGNLVRHRLGILFRVTNITPDGRVWVQPNCQHQVAPQPMDASLLTKTDATS